jgi:acyl-CoA reductase-like NAD-dependent aldehyde dehydrogenase
MSSTPPDEIDRMLLALSDARHRWRDTPLAERVRLARQCADGVYAAAGDWVAAACQAKGIALDSPAAAEEIAAGPLAVMRYLKLMIASLRATDRGGRPRLSGRLLRADDGRLRIPLFPARGLYDSLLFPGYHGSAWLFPDVEADDYQKLLADGVQKRFSSEGTALVLGAGNVSSIPAVDALMKLLQDNRVVLLKLNPVNDYLGPIFESAFQPLIAPGFWQLCYGGAEVGTYAAQHQRVDEVHITGSLAAHESIVWGPPGPDQERRRIDGRPLLEKPITSELGNVTPWVVVPGAYSQRQLDFQAENVAAMIVNNASFNCIAAKLIVTCRQWPDRDRFLDKLQAVLDRTPRRSAYYPGACDRFCRFTGRKPDGASDTLPWTLVRDIDPDRQPHWVHEESFVCVCAETAIDASSPGDFLDRAVEFVNDRVWGTLGIGLMVHPSFRRSPDGKARWRAALSRLRYGTIGVNVWPGLAYATMWLPWGGYPGATLSDPQSGIGWVHNTCLLEGVEKSVIEAPLVAWPKPLWFPSHRQSHVLARRVLDLYHRPAYWKLPSLAGPALSC